MELNLNDEYYQKYQKYKKKYIMLKQLKNNNELKGGGIINSIMQIFGFGKKEEEEITETFLVFHIPSEILSDINQLQEFIPLTELNVEKDINMNAIDEKKDNNTDVFMKSNAFFEKYIRGYIITNINGSWKARFINDESTKISFHYDEISAYIQKLKEIKNEELPQIVDEFDHKPDEGSKTNKTISTYIQTEITDLIKSIDATKKKEIENKIRLIEEYASTNTLKRFDEIELNNVNITPKNDLDESFLKFLKMSLNITNDTDDARPLNFILKIQKYNDGDEYIKIDDEIHPVTIAYSSWKTLNTTIKTDKANKAIENKEKEEKIKQQQAEIDRLENEAKSKATTDSSVSN